MLPPNPKHRAINTKYEVEAKVPNVANLLKFIVMRVTLLLRH